jgi:RNA polymerase sigma-70 factor (ECF subfamily)
MTLHRPVTRLRVMFSVASQHGSSVHGWPADRWPAAAPVRHDEQALVRALRAHEEHAFAALVRRHHASMIRVARLYVADRALAEEVAQETWLAVFSEIDDFQERCSLRTWIYRILVNRARSRGQREHRIVPFCTLESASRPTVEPSQFRDGAWCNPPRPWHDPERRLLTLEVREALRTALGELPERQRAVVTLRDVHGLTPEEVCTVLEINAGNQRVLLHRGRARLRQLLEDYHRPSVEALPT